MNELNDDDNDRRRIAEEIDQAHPHWMVMYGISSRMFWAFKLFGHGGFLAAGSRHELEHRMDAAEKEHWNRRRPR